MLRRLSPDPEQAAVLGVRLDALRRTGLILVAAVGGLGGVLAAFALMARQPMFLAGALLAFLLAPVLYMYPLFEVRSRLGRAEGELLPAAVYATIYAAAERDMAEGFFAVAREADLAPSLSAMAKGVERLQLKRFIPTSYEALGEAARLFEGSKVSDFLITMSVARTVGLSQYIQARDLLRSVLFELKSAYARLAENLKTLGEVILVFFGVLPLMLFITTTIFYSSGASMQLLAYTFVGIPLLTVALAFLLDASYPKTPEKFLKWYRLYGIGAAAGVAAGFAVYMAVSPLGLPVKSLPANGLPFLRDIRASYAAAIALGVAAAVVFGFVVPKYLAESSRRWGLISALPFFTRDLAELVKTGLSPAQAVVRLAERKTYNRHFDRLLRDVMRRIVSGATFSEAVKAAGAGAPWFARVVLHASAEAEKLGARHEIFAELADTSRELVDILKAARANARGSVMFGFMTIGIIAVLLGGVVKTLVFQVADYATNMPAAGAVPMNIQLITWSRLPEVLRYALVGAVINSVALGVLIGKMSDGNFFASALYGLIASIIATASIFASLFI
jgi:flagellar protein FlaJ